MHVRRLSRILMGAMFFLLWAPGPAWALKITKGPYLQWVTTSSIYVVWDQDVASKAEVRYGKTAALGSVTPSKSSGTHHEVPLQGLSPNTKYYYTVYQGGSKISPDLTLLTAVNPGTAFRFVALGDTRSQAKEHAATISAVAKETGVRFYLNTGDLVSDGEVKSQWDEFFTLESALISRIPLYPVLGNHDESDGKAPLYLQQFVLPTGSPDPEEYYSFDYGNVHFVVLDGHVNVEPWYLCVLRGKLFDECFTADQVSWLDYDLYKASLNAKIDHIFVLTHMGPYSSKQGRQGSAQMRDLMAMFKKYKVSIIISGHDHYYEHGTSGNGIPYIITGGGGAPLYALGWPSFNPHKVIYNKSIYHYLVIEVNGKYVKVTAKTPQGVKLEEFAFGSLPPPLPDGGVPDSGVPDASHDGGAAQPDSDAASEVGVSAEGPPGDMAVSGDAGDGPSPAGDSAITQEEGCDCRVSPGSGPGWLPLLLLCLLVHRHRSRRRKSKSS